MAMAVMVTAESAQPALLYLVPSTLGLFCVASFLEGTLPLMWRGPPSLNTDKASNSSENGCCARIRRVCSRKESTSAHVNQPTRDRTESELEMACDMPLVTEPESPL